MEANPYEPPQAVNDLSASHPNHHVSDFIVIMISLVIFGSAIGIVTFIAWLAGAQSPYR